MGGKGFDESPLSVASPGGWNGGGNASTHGSYITSSGGGATDIRTMIDSTGSWDDSDSLFSRILVAGGGGSAVRYQTNNTTGGAGGGISGTAGSGGSSAGKGGTATAGGVKGTYSGSTAQDGSFGRGGNAPQYLGGAGGGGWYGGGAGAANGGNGGGGSGFAYTADTTLPTGYLANSQFLLAGATLIAGNQAMPAFDGTSTMTGNAENGYAKITSITKSNDNYLHSVELSYGTQPLQSDFKFNRDTATVKIPYGNLSINIAATTKDNRASVSNGAGVITTPDADSNFSHVIEIEAENGEKRTYTLNFERTQDNSLKKITLDYAGKVIDIQEGIYEYTVDWSPNDHHTDVTVEAYSNDTAVEVVGEKYIGLNEHQIIITANKDDFAPKIYKIILNINPNQNYVAKREFSGRYQIFRALQDGEYKLEAWGARGGQTTKANTAGGRGGYSTGIVNLDANEELYIFVGGKGFDNSPLSVASPGGWNGGGNAAPQPNHISSSGGGATDFRTIIDETGSWDNSDSLLSRILVAGGGGSAVGYNTNGTTGGYGGGLSGGAGWGGALAGKGATQTAGGAKGTYSGSTAAAGGFGYGADGPRYLGGAGGGGWYGGGSGAADGGAGGGGSGFVYTSGSTNLPANYSPEAKYQLASASTIAGNSAMPSSVLGGTMTGNTDDGFARITADYPMSNDNYLDSLTLKDVTAGANTPITLDFASWKTNYDIHLNDDTYTVNIAATLKDSKSKIIAGQGRVAIRGASTTHELVVEAEDGDRKYYTFNFTKDSNPDDTGLRVVEISEFNDPADPTDLRLIESISEPVAGTEISAATVRAQTEKIAFFVEANEPLTTYTIELNGVSVNDSEKNATTGAYTLSLATGENRVVITTTSPNGNYQATYTFIIIRQSESLSITLDSAAILVSITPTTEGSFVNNSTTFLVSTNNSTGHTLYMNSGENIDATGVNNALLHQNFSSPTGTSGSGAKISSITASGIKPANFPNNTWGFNLQKRSIAYTETPDLSALTVSGANNNSQYSALPTTKSAVDSATSASVTNYRFTIGAKADFALPVGEYSNKVVICVVAND